MAPDGVDAQPGGTSPESSKGGDMRRGIAFVVLGITASAASVAPAAGQQGGASPPDTVRVSVSSAGRQANDINGRFSFPALDARGRVVAFDSIATNLVRSDTNGDADVFVHEQATQETSRISVSTRGREANEDSQRPDVSGHGRLVVFDSSATNLVPGRDTNGVLDVFLHDRSTGRTTLVSEALGGGTGNASSFEPAISRDGRYVAFTSDATDLTRRAVSGARDVFVRDLQTGRTRVVSLTTTGEPTGGASNGPAISADGRYVGFGSFAADVVPGDTNDAFDVFVRDRVAGETSRVSVSTDGGQAVGGGSFAAAISGDGQLVAFSSEATNLVAGDTNDVRDVFVHNSRNGRTARVSVGAGRVQADGQSDGPGIRGGSSAGPDISGNGRYVAFDSIATNLVAGDTNTCAFRGGQQYDEPGQCPDVFVRDRWQRTTERVSITATGAQADSSSTDPRISADGRRVAFFSAATNLVAGDTNTCPPFFSTPGQCPDIFVRSR